MYDNANRTFEATEESDDETTTDWGFARGAVARTASGVSGRHAPRHPDEERDDVKRARTDGGADVCEIDGAADHAGEVKIVVDDTDEVVAMCANCRDREGYDRVLEDNLEAAADGGQTFTAEHEELMDVELSDLEAAKNVLEQYYGDHQPRTRVTVAEGGRCLVVITGSSRFKHESLFRETPALDIRNTQAIDVSDENEDPDLRLKVEVKEVSA